MSVLSRWRRAEEAVEAVAPPPPRTIGLDRRLRKALADVVGDDHLRVSDGDVAPFARDATPLFSSRPDAVVFPGSTTEVAAVLRLATEHGVPVVPRGAGSNLCAGTVALRGGIVSY